MTTLKHIYNIILIAVLIFGLSGCDNNDPEKEDVPELITEVTLVFTTDRGSTTQTVTATDPDGEGVQDMVFGYPAELELDKTYTMKILLKNGLAEPGTEQYDVASEVAEEGEEHMFFFEWSPGIFSDPAGDGNFDTRADAVNYVGGTDSNDANGLPLGLTTTWTTESEVETGTLRIILKHQPGLKSTTSGSDVGETDLDITFHIVVH